MDLPRELRSRLDRIPSHQRTWILTGLTTEPADRPCAEAAAMLLYEALGHARPRRFVWGRSPAEAQRRYEDDGAAPLLPRVVGALPMTSRADPPEAHGWDFGAEVRWHVWHCVGRHVVSRLSGEPGCAIVELAWFGQLDAAGLATVTIRASGGRMGAALDAYDLLAQSAGFAFAATTGTCYLSERPRTMHLDGRGQLHAADGPALVYADGWSLHAWHGEMVSPRVVGPDAGLTVEDIHHATNVELRRHLLARMGFERYLSETAAQCVHRDACGELYRIELRNDEPLVLVHVVNATPEPDGTRRRYTLRVPPTMRTAREAVAWTFALHPDDYHPDVES